MFLISVLIRASKKIPSEVVEWMQYMKHHNGAVFFILAVYTNVNGELTVSRSGVRSNYSRYCLSIPDLDMRRKDRSSLRKIRMPSRADQIM